MSTNCSQGTIPCYLPCQLRSKQNNKNIQSYELYYNLRSKNVRILILGEPGARVSWVGKKCRESFQERVRESLWDTTRNGPVPRLIRMIACDCLVSPSQSPASITLLSTRLFPRRPRKIVSRLLVWLENRRAFFDSTRVFSENEPPQFTLPVSLDRLVYHAEEKNLTTYLQSLKDGKISPARPA